MITSLQNKANYFRVIMKITRGIIDQGYLVSSTCEAQTNFLTWAFKPILSELTSNFGNLRLSTANVKLIQQKSHGQILQNFGVLTEAKSFLSISNFQLPHI